MEHTLVELVEHTLVEHTLCPSRQHGQTESRGAVFPIAFPRPAEMQGFAVSVRSSRGTAAWNK